MRMIAAWLEAAPLPDATLSIEALVRAVEKPASDLEDILLQTATRMLTAFDLAPTGDAARVHSGAARPGRTS